MSRWIFEAIWLILQMMDERRESELMQEPGKIVGRRRAPNLLDPSVDTKEKARAWRRAFPTPFVPKGVYKFASHEEAQQWLDQHLTKRS